MKPSYLTFRLFAEAIAIIALVEAAIMFLLPLIAPGVSGAAETTLDTALLTFVAGSLILWRMIAALKRAGDERQTDETWKALFPVRGLAVVLALTLTLLTVTVLVAMNHVAWSRDDAALLEDLQGQVLVLDERLTMSARLTAATNDTFWQVRYRVAKKDLDAVLKDLDALLDRRLGKGAEKARIALASTSHYSDALIVLENQCFTLVQAGDRAGAMAAVMSDEYDRLKDLYTQAVAQADAETDLLVDHAKMQDRQYAFTIAWMGLLSAVVMFGAMVWSVGRSRARAMAMAAEMTKDLRASEAGAQAALANLASYRAALDEQIIIALTDASGTITEVNEPFCRISGYSREELIGANHRIVNSGHHPRAFWAEMWKSIARGEVWRAEVCNKAKDGSLYWLDTTIGPVRDATGKISGYIAVRIDITKRKRAELELRQAHDKLESRVAQRTAQLAEAKNAAVAACQAKSEFLASMSHELRTPLNGVIGMMELLLRTKLSPQQRRHAWLAKSSGDMLLSLINDILDFSKIEAGCLDLESMGFDLHYTVESAVACISSRAADKGLELVCAVDPAVPRRLQGDPGRVQQVLANLVGNAVKFTEKGEVVLRVTKDEETDHDVIVRITVTDTGIGIPAGRIDKLFLSFSQIDSSTTRKYGGTGLGLAICKRLVEAMGGEIGVTSTEGCGSTFWFTLKLAKQAEHASPTSERREMGHTPSSLPDDRTVSLRLPEELHESSSPRMTIAKSAGGRILLAEDNEISKEVASTILRRAGFLCDVVPNGREAVEAVKSGEYDLVLMDCQMPEMDGFQATQAIRSFEQEHLLSGGPVKRIPIIALTANAIQGDRERCLAAGMDDYASKPLNSERLLRLIDAHLGAHEQDTTVPDQSELATGEARPERAAFLTATSALASAPLRQQPPAFDTEKMLKSWGNDQSFVQRLIAKFSARAPDDLRKLREAIEKNDATEAQRLAHGLKGAAGYVAAENVRQLAAQLEAMAREGDLSNTEARLSELAAELQRCADEAPYGTDADEAMTKSAHLKMGETS